MWKPRNPRPLGWGVAVTVAVVVVFVLGGGLAEAKKPPKPPPPPPPPPAEPVYTIEDVGEGFGPYLRRLNDSGALCGIMGPPSTNPAAYLLEPSDTNGDGLPDTWFVDANDDGVNDLLVGLGYLDLLPNPDERRAWAMGLNNAGMVVGGSSDLTSDVPGVQVQHAFLWTNGTMHDLGTAVHASMQSWAKEVSDAGVVLGLVDIAPGTPSGIEKEHFILLPETATDGSLIWFRDTDADGLNDLMQTLGVGFAATDINGDGWIAGRYTIGGTQAAVLIPLDTDADGEADTWFQDEDADGVNDLVVLLSAPSGAQSSNAWAINENGWLVGFWSTAVGDKYAALWSPLAAGGFEALDLGEVVGCYETEAVDINDDNVILGTGRISTKGPVKSVRKLWIWQDGLEEELESLVDTMGQDLGPAVAINNRADILLGESADGGPVVLVRTP